MVCYYHPDRQAVGLCKLCMRALCMECGAEVSQGLACKNRCEEEAEDLIDLIRLNLRFRQAAIANAKGTRTAMVVASVFITLFGAFLVWAGFGSEGVLWVLVVMGGLIGSYGVFLFVRSLRHQIPR